MSRKKKPAAPEKPGPVLRCDHLPHFMNRGKERAVLDLLAEWRTTAAVVGAIQWRRFWAGLPFDKDFDAATEHRKGTVEARGRLVSLIALRGERELDPSKTKPTRKEREERGVEKEPRRIAPLAPGFEDPLGSAKERLGAARVQMARYQVAGMLASFLSNRQNDFASIVWHCSLPERDRRMLLAVNRQQAWFALDRPVPWRVVDGDGVAEEFLVPDRLRRLARKVMSHVLRQHRKPSTHHIGMVLDRRAVALAPSSSATTFALWMELQALARAPKRDGKPGRDFASIQVPLRDYAFFNRRQGVRKATIQVSQDRETGRLTFGVMTDTRPAIEERQAEPKRAYVSLRDTLSLDFGLATLLATNEGDLLGRGWLQKLQRFDHTLTKIARHRQRSGDEPRTSARYRALVRTIRGFIRTEVNRILNRLIHLKRPGHLVVERLDFRCPGLSRHLNRIIQNCGRSVFRAKLKALEEEFGITHEEVNAAYTSQTCACCGYVDKRNRPDRQTFRCLWCGHKKHADVNAAENIGARRSDPIGSRWVGRRRILAELMRRFRERHPGPWPGRTGSHRGTPADPRLGNPYFADWPAQARSPAGSASDREKSAQPQALAA